MPVKISNFRNGTSKKTILYYFHFLCCESIIDRVSITGVSITGNKSCKHCFFCKCAAKYGRKCPPNKYVHSFFYRFKLPFIHCLRVQRSRQKPVYYFYRHWFSLTFSFTAFNLFVYIINARRYRRIHFQTQRKFVETFSHWIQNRRILNICKYGYQDNVFIVVLVFS